MKIGLQTRFTLLIVALILVLVGILSGGLLLQVRTLTEEIRNASGEVVGEAMLDQIQEDGKALAETLADNLPNHLYFFRMDTIKELTRSVRYQNVIYVYVHDEDGVILQDGTRTMESLGLDVNDMYLQTMLETKKVVAWFTSHEAGRDEDERIGTAIAGVQAYHVSAPVILGDDVIGGVRIGLGLKNIHADIAAEQKRLTDISETRLERLLMLAGTATVFLLLLGIALSAILGRWLSRPIVALADTAREIGRGRYAVDVPEDRNDEIGDLALSIKEMAKDIDERDRLQSQLAQHQKISALDDMVGGIAHNFNNLMQPIQVLAPMVREKLAEDSRERKSMDIVIQCCNGARELVSRISEFSREAPFHRETVDLYEFVRKELDLIAPIVPSSIQLDTELDDNVGRAVVDVTELQTVLLNLVNNATDAIDGHNGRLAISLSRSQSTPIDGISGAGLKAGPFAVLTVADDGKGIAPEAMDRIFDPFYTTKSVGEGTGLGLSTAYGIVTRLGGTITATSSPGQETRFDVFIPLASPDLAA